MKSTTTTIAVQAAGHERELLRAARVARFRRGTWKDFWAQHREEVLQYFPLRAERAALVDRLQMVVLLGIRGEVQSLFDTVPGVQRASELEVP